MAKQLRHTKKYTPYQTTQIGEDDDAASPFWLIRKQAERRLYEQQPNLTHDEIRQKVDRLMKQGMKPSERSRHQPPARKPSKRKRPNRASKKRSSDSYDPSSPPW